MRAEIGRLDPFIEFTGTGVLGRMSDVLLDKGYNVKTYGIDTDLAILEGIREDTVKQAANSQTGFIAFNPSALDDEFGNDLRSKLRILNKAGNLHNNIFSDTVSNSMVSFCC